MRQDTLCGDSAPSIEDLEKPGETPESENAQPASGHLINRELSWLAFNARVLSEAQNPVVPLAERLKYLAIVGSNLDEFFMVRFAGLKRQLLADDGAEVSPDGLAVPEQLAAVSDTTHNLVEAQYKCWREEVQPRLEAEAGVRLPSPKTQVPQQRADLSSYFHRGVWPVLTP